MIDPQWTRFPSCLTCELLSGLWCTTSCLSMIVVPLSWWLLITCFLLSSPLQESLSLKRTTQQRIIGLICLRRLAGVLFVTLLWTFGVFATQDNLILDHAVNNASTFKISRGEKRRRRITNKCNINRCMHVQWWYRWWPEKLMNDVTTDQVWLSRH